MSHLLAWLDPSTDPLNLTQQPRAPHISTRRGVIVSLPFHLYSCKPSQCLRPEWKGIYNLPFWVGTAFVPFLKQFYELKYRTCQSHLTGLQLKLRFHSGLDVVIYAYFTADHYCVPDEWLLSVYIQRGINIGSFGASSSEWHPQLWPRLFQNSSVVQRGDVMT